MQKVEIHKVNKPFMNKITEIIYTSGTSHTVVICFMILLYSNSVVILSVQILKASIKKSLKDLKTESIYVW